MWKCKISMSRYFLVGALFAGAGSSSFCKCTCHTLGMSSNQSLKALCWEKRFRASGVFVEIAGGCHFGGCRFLHGIFSSTLVGTHLLLSPFRKDLGWCHTLLRKGFWRYEERTIISANGGMPNHVSWLDIGNQRAVVRGPTHQTGD